MSEIARANGWRGFDGLGERVKGGYEYRCDGMPSLMGCGADVTVPRAWTSTGIKKSGWFVCFGLDDEGEPEPDVVLTFCPRCTAVVLTSTHSIDRCVKCGGPDGFHDPACVVHPMDHQPTDPHVDHANRSQEES